MNDLNLTTKEIRTAISEYANTLAKDGLKDIMLDEQQASQVDPYFRILFKHIMLDAPGMKTALAGDYEEGSILHKNDEKAVALYRQAFEEGDIAGAYNLAWDYYTSGDYITAIEYFDLCIKNADKLSDWAVMKSYGILGDSYTRLSTPDYAKAIENLTIASEKFGQGYSSRRLGMIYADSSLNGIYDMQKARMFFEKAAREGDLPGAVELANFYIYGEPSQGIYRNRNKAIEALEPFFENGNSEVFERAGMAYMRGDETVKPDYGMAAMYYEKAVQCGDGIFKEGYLEHHLGYVKEMSGSDGLSLLEYADTKGYCEYSGILGNAYYDKYNTRRAVNFATAKYYYQRAEQCSSLNIYQLANYAEVLSSNDLSVADYYKAMEVAERGIREHNDVAFYKIKGMLVITGKVSSSMSRADAAKLLEDLKGYDVLDKDSYKVMGDFFMETKLYRKAEIYLIEAFNRGDADSGFKLAVMYENGGGTIVASIEKGVEWYKRAAEAGSQAAKEELTKFAEKMFGGYKRVRR